MVSIVGEQLCATVTQHYCLYGGQPNVFRLLCYLLWPQGSPVAATGIYHRTLGSMVGSCCHLCEPLRIVVCNMMSHVGVIGHSGSSIVCMAVHSLSLWTGGCIAASTARASGSKLHASLLWLMCFLWTCSGVWCAQSWLAV
jgi:hypothetical protein